MKKLFLRVGVLILTLVLLLFTACENLLTCKVEFIVDGEVYAELEISLTQEEEPEWPEDPTKEGMVFVGWFPSEEVTEGQEEIDPTTILQMLLKDGLKLYAQFVEEETVGGGETEVVA